MKKAGVESAMITPAADGWLLHSGGTAAQPVATLADAVGALPASTPVSLALPCTALVIEGLKLPATERDEGAPPVQSETQRSEAQDLGHSCPRQRARRWRSALCVCAVPLYHRSLVAGNPSHPTTFSGQSRPQQDLPRA